MVNPYLLDTTLTKTPGDNSLNDNEQLVQLASLDNGIHIQQRLKSFQVFRFPRPRRVEKHFHVTANAGDHLQSRPVGSSNTHPVRLGCVHWRASLD